MEAPVKIIITDNSKKFRDTLKQELKPYNTIECICESNNGKELLTQLENLIPDIILLDLEMPVMDGNETMDHLMELYPETKVIVISLSYEQLLVEDLNERGAKGYIPKDELLSNMDLFLKALKIVKDGGVFFHHLPIESQVNPFKYSQKQKIIVPLMAQGFTNEDIAEEIGIDIRSVERQRQKIYLKLGGDKAIDFFRYAFSKGLHFLRDRRKLKGKK